MMTLDPTNLTTALMQAVSALVTHPASRPTLHVVSRTPQRVRLFAVAQIGCFFAQGRRTGFYVQGQLHQLTASLRALQRRLTHQAFARVHRQTLVNLRHIRAVRPVPGGLQLILRDRQQVAVSRRQRSELLQRLRIKRRRRPPTPPTFSS